MKRILLILAMIGFSGNVFAQDKDKQSYCNFVLEQAKGQSGLLRVPQATAGVTQPNTGTAPQLYSGIMGSLSDLRKGGLTIRAAQENCELYKTTTDAQQVIQYALPSLEKEARQHRLGLIEDAIQRVDTLIADNMKLVNAQNATKQSLYTLQAAKLRLNADKASVQNSLAAQFVPDLPNAPLTRLVMAKQSNEESSQRAMAKLAKQGDWDFRWEVGGHRTIHTPNSQVGVQTPSGVYGGVTINYNLDSHGINKHFDAAAKSYGDWKREQETDVVQGAETVRQQVVRGITVEDNKLAELRAQDKDIQDNVALVKDASTSASLTFLNQLTADELVLRVDEKDAEFRLTRLREYLAYNFPSELGKAFAEGRVSITFDDGFQSAYNILPILDKAGVRGTWYVITHMLNKQEYMSSEEVKRLAADGQEIGAHSQTHPHLPTLTLAQQEQEIGGSSTDLAALGVNAKSFAYPYGEFNDSTVAALVHAGFQSARTTDRTRDGQNPYQLQGFSVSPTTTLGEILGAIDFAKRNGTWVILTFHRFDETGNPISVPRELLQQTVDYIVRNKIKTVTVSEGMATN